MSIQVSPYNRLGREGTQDGRSVFLCDVTARDGEQTVGVSFTVEEKIELARRLDSLGIKQLQYAAVKSSEEATRAAKAVCALNLNANIEIMSFINAPDWRDQVLAALDCGADIIHALIPVSRQTRGVNVPLSDEATIGRALEYIDFARSSGAKMINLNMLDCPRVEESFFEKLVTACVSAGIDRMRVNDTVGTATPDSIRYLVGKAKSIIRELGAKTIIGIHCHDDFGLAGANTVAGILAGADFADVAVNGLGERAGNADLAQIAIVLTLLYGVDCGLRGLEGLYELSRYVERISGIPVPATKPLVGDFVFSDQSDNHNAAFAKNPYAYQGILPELVGNKRLVMIGKKTGPYTLDLKLKEMGFVLPEENKNAALNALKNVAASFRGRPLPDAEFEAVILKHGGRKQSSSHTMEQSLRSLDPA